MTGEAVTFELTTADDAADDWQLTTDDRTQCNHSNTVHIAGVSLNKPISTEGAAQGARYADG